MTFRPRRRLIGFVALVVVASVAAPTLRAADAPKEGAAKAIELFNGKDLTGWKHAGPGEFKVQDGTLVTSGGMGLLWTEQEFSDFTLRLQFKVKESKNNSGIFVRFSDPGNDPWVAVKEGYEIQICDTEKGNETGSIYNFKRSTEVASKPAGEWNQYEITADGTKLTLKVNGLVQNEGTDFEAKPGKILLQSEGAEIEFQNIELTPIQ